ncbi:bifunctional diaminohydroxyphosphoribosylaminopyrimidine deaminase/5-amino-6-(5-phosphoribosylamino)uracil reductase RibD [Candidatus Daviesbacteria bacterium]|nr:bifunctional diaminohydroxyphosphoribosylaminopyrimidine deaminase/5-amino-6-(5-phosphoribosylamino)uracil reductase RibD [Candidatus Daviesbacteria bacterium]
MPSDQSFLSLCLRLARKGLGWTNPNPLAGAVLVRNNRIIGRGFHHQVGKAHAEIEALAVSEDPKGATLYVNLEPCSSFGKTPPCVDTIIEKKIKKVVFSTLDPNPKNYGKGLAKLQQAGIETSVGILETEARRLNEAFFIFHEKNRPFIVLKFAASLDGKIATYTGDSRWITNEKARLYARNLRGQYQAILAGINTILADNPNLGTRIKGKKDPIRIILDAELKIPLNAQVLRDNNVIIATTTKANKSKQAQLEKKGVTVWLFDQITINKILSKLKEETIISILVEGGGQTLGEFVDAKIIDKVYAFHAPLIIGGEKAISIGRQGASTIKQALHLQNVIFKRFEDNLLTIGYIQKV